MLLALVLLAGCASIRTTRALGSLQAEYGEIVRTEAACEAGTEASDVCVGDFPAMYGFIEAQAAEAIEARPAEQALTEQQITIALHRLAAFAALRSNSGNSAAYGDKGKALCASIQVKPPRDCALLQVVGQYEVVEKYAADVQCLIHDEADCDRTFEAAADEFCRLVYNPLVEKTAAAKADPLLPGFVAKYLDIQVAETRKPQQALAANLTAGLAFDAKPSDPCECVRLDRSAPSFGQLCGSVAREPVATFKAECVRKALDGGHDCPTM